jgi:phosphohistidine phosphatase
MILYLIRHAEAVELGSPSAFRDFDRALTQFGHDQSAALGNAFLRLKLPLNAVVASPLVRAHQTGVDLLSVVAPGSRPITHDALAPDRLKPGKLSEFLASVPGSAIAAVGHMPDLGDYAEWLIGSAPGSIRLAKAATACIEFKNGPAKGEGKLRWLITPEWFLPRP